MNRRHVRARRLDAVPPPPPDVTAWLDRLRDLQGVPFEHLVADARLLPVESLRFFHLDHNWRAALTAGALSAVAGTEADAYVAAALGPEPPPTADGPSGVLLRSALVAGFPELTVTGWADPHGKEPPMTPLRTDRPGPSVLLVLFPRLVRRVEIAQPAAGLAFGTGARPPQVAPRSLGGPGHPTGRPMRPAHRVPVPLRDEARGVVDVGALAGRLAEALAAAYAPAPAPPLTPAGLGLQLVAPPQRRAFHGEEPNR
ncbi:hypothetical protein [Dactylosporangium sp. NPDC051541]|uniref:hypothetical protein n=1 Tax=Dactylosporangium sp. NPDC051541 TaxID=3363977 RepID=UPI0037A60C1A